MSIRNIILQKRDDLAGLNSYYVDTNDIRTLSIYLSHAGNGTASFFCTDDPEHGNCVTNPQGMAAKEWLPLPINNDEETTLDLAADGSPTKIILDCYLCRYLRIDVDTIGSTLLFVSMYTDDTGR